MIALFLSLIITVVPPVPGRVTQRFVAPACLRCAGHRGVTIDNPDGHAVVSAVSGRITFAGEVAHRLFVVVEPEPGVLVTVGWLESVVVARGDLVETGQPVGTAGATTYLGVRSRGLYVEPLGYLGLGGARLLGTGAVVGHWRLRR